MTAIDANARGKPWTLTTTLNYPKVTIYLAVTTSAEVTPCLTTTHIIHVATTRSQDAAEAAEGAETPKTHTVPIRDCD